MIQTGAPDEHECPNTIVPISRSSNVWNLLSMFSGHTFSNFWIKLHAHTIQHPHHSHSNLEILIFVLTVCENILQISHWWPTAIHPDFPRWPDNCSDNSLPLALCSRYKSFFFWWGCHMPRSNLSKSLKCHRDRRARIAMQPHCIQSKFSRTPEARQMNSKTIFILFREPRWSTANNFVSHIVRKFQAVCFTKTKRRTNYPFPRIFVM